MSPGAAQGWANSWYHEKESAWLYGVVAMLVRRL
jgi:hypothetical protein